jgi:hypothetical protein
LLVAADLYGGQSHPGGFVHCFSHIGDKLLNDLVDILDRFGRLLQKFVRIGQYF